MSIHKNKVFSSFFVLLFPLFLLQSEIIAAPLTLEVTNIDRNTISIYGQISTNPQDLKNLGISHVIGTKDLALLVKQLNIISIAQSGTVKFRSPNYTCESTTGECTCNNNDPLDCILMLDKCSNYPTGSDGLDCILQPGNCSCNWKKY